MRLKTELYFAECPVGKWGMHNLTRSQLDKIRKFCDAHIVAGRMTAKDVKILYKYIEEVTGRRQTVSMCASCVRDALESLRNGLKDKYKEEK